MGWKVIRKRPEEITNKTISIRDFFNAIKENGLPQARRKFWSSSRFSLAEVNVDEFQKAEIGEACAIGQAALNLGTDWQDLVFILSSTVPGLKGRVISANDTYGYSLGEIYTELVDRYHDQLDIKFDIPENIRVIKD